MSDELSKNSGLSRRDFVRIAAGTAGVAGIAAGLGLPGLREAAAKPPKTKIDTPRISCGAGSTQASINIEVCAPSGTGATGLPAGFSLQWMTCDDYATNGNQWYASDDPRLCKASFSGNAFGSRYNLAAGECVTVNVGEFLFDSGASTNCPDALLCGTCYVFRAFGHATSTLNRSDFTGNTECRTLECLQDCDPVDCTFTQGYWKTHGPAGCNPAGGESVWPDLTGQCTCNGGDGLCLGSTCYSADQLCAILNTSAGGTNQTIALEHQLIAAKLNILKGADGTDAAQCIIDADAAIAAGTTTGLGSLITCLRDYNEGLTGPGHCC
jgi:hypothetical protein